MRFPVFSKNSNPSIDRPIVRKKRGHVESMVVSGLAVWVDLNEPRLGVICRSLCKSQDLDSILSPDGPFGVGNMVPFAKIPSKLRQPQKLHYAIPACGAHGRLLRVHEINFEPMSI